MLTRSSLSYDFCNSLVLTLKHTTRNKKNVKKMHFIPSKSSLTTTIFTYFEVRFDTKCRWKKLRRVLYTQKVHLKMNSEMLFSFKNKYHYTYPNTYIALYSRTPKLPVTHTHPQKQEIVVHPS